MISTTNIKGIVKEAVKELDKEKEISTIAFSTVSQSKVMDYLETIDLVMYEGEPLDKTHTSFEPFHWQAQENTDTPRAIVHLQEQLEKFGIVFGRNNYQMYEVHLLHGILSVRDCKSGSLSGGTDALIAPYGLVVESAPRQSCVAFELKTKEAVEKNGLKSYLGQATMELIAANYHSRQMTLVVLTDLVSRCILLTFTRESNAIAIIKYEDVSLDQMASFVQVHLDRNCSSHRAYQLPTVDEGNRESEVVMKVWKKARVSDFTSSLDWEHFQEMMEDAPVGSKERALAIRDHFHHHGLPDTNYLSMFS